MSNRLSGTTTPIALRLPNDVVAILDRRAKKQGKLVSDHLRSRVIYDTLRKHTRKAVNREV